MIEINFSQTGDPFIDAGGMVLEEYQQQFTEATLWELVEQVAGIYINSWGKKLNALFLNSKITNVSVKKNLEETMIYYRSLEHPSDIKGYCKTCGYEGDLFAAGRNLFPLSGSGKFLNFHHSFEEGSYLCGFCIVKLFFLPLGIVMLGGNVALLQINSSEVKKLWKEKTLAENWGHLATGSSKSILKSSYSNPTNALFYFARDLIMDMQEIQEQAGNQPQTLTLFHFTNFGASPDCSIYTLNQNVFQFLTKILVVGLKQEWNRFVNLHYRLSKGSKADPITGIVVKVMKDQEIEQEAGEYQNSRNTIYQSLLNGYSITRHLMQQQENDFENKRETMFPIMIAVHYGKEILQMTQEQFDTLKKLVQGIFQIYGDSQADLEKALKKIRDANTKAALRKEIVRLCEKNYQAENEQALITLKEINFHLLGNNLYWGEVKDYLLIYFYELLHEKRIQLSDSIFEEELVDSEDSDNIFGSYTAN